MTNQLQNKINELKPYVIGIRFVQELTVVDTILNEGWTVPQSSVIKAAKSEGAEPGYNMFYTETPSVTLDDILAFIGETIRVNIEREKKFELLKTKVEELKEFFKNNPLDKLMNMKFVLGDRNILPDKLTEDLLNTDEFNLNIDETLPTLPQQNIEAEVIDDKPLQVEQRDEVSEFNTKAYNYDLPPKKNGKIELEDFEVPVTPGPCTHPSDQFCPKCMDSIEY